MEAGARGRVWTGEDAQRVGLVDGLGGYAEALQLTRQTIGIAPDAGIERVSFPRELDSFDAVLDALRSGEIGAMLTKLERIAMYAGPLMRLLPERGDGMVRAEAVAPGGFRRREEARVGK